MPCGLSGVAARGSPPYIRAPSDQTFGGAAERSCRTHIEIEDRLAGWLRWSLVVVDDVADLGLLAIDGAGDEPVVTVERRLSAVERDPVSLVVPLEDLHRKCQTYPKALG